MIILLVHTNLKKEAESTFCIPCDTP